MPLYKSIPLPGGLLAVWQITETSEEMISGFSNDELKGTFFQNIQYEKRKIEWLAIRALLKEVIGQNFEIWYTKAGKPMISHPDYKFISISHSRNFASVVVDKKSSVGIDIESINRNYAAIKNKFLSEIELEKVNDDSFQQCLYWCAKEAIFKLVDDEGIDFRKQIQIEDFNPGEDVFTAQFLKGDSKKTFQLHWTSFNDHCLVWVSSNPKAK